MMSDSSVKVTARIVSPKDFDLGLYDSATGKTIKAKIALELDDAKCRTVLLFAETKRGDIVQILHPYPKENYGAASHYHIDAIDAEWLDLWSKLSGITTKKMREFIRSGRALLQSKGGK